MGLEEVAAQGGAVEAPHHDVGVDPGRAILHGDVPHEGEHLDLLVDAEAPVFAPGDVEEAQHGRAEGADPREVSAQDGSRLGELGETVDQLLAWTEEHHQPLLPL